MTAEEMKYEIDIKLKGLPEPMKRLFVTLDYNKFLNEAMLSFFVTAYSTIDRTELEKKIMPVLVQTFTYLGPFSNITSNFPNGYTIPLPVGFEFALSEYVTLLSIPGIIPVKEIRYNQYVSNINNPFYQPYEGLVWRLDYDGEHELITDGLQTITKYVARYLRKPIPIDVDAGIDCEINPLYHSIIVNSAVQRIIESVTRLMQKEQPKQKQEQENTN